MLLLGLIEYTFHCYAYDSFFALNRCGLLHYDHVEDYCISA